MNEETPYNPPYMADYIREGARKNSALLRKWKAEEEAAATAEAKGGSHQRACSTALTKTPKSPRGETYECPWCELRKLSSKWTGLSCGKTGKPVCPDCEEQMP